jgi:hypothetical protein
MIAYAHGGMVGRTKASIEKRRQLRSPSEPYRHRVDGQTQRWTHDRMASASQGIVSVLACSLVGRLASTPLDLSVGVAIRERHQCAEHLFVAVRALFGWKSRTGAGWDRSRPFAPT